MKFSRNSQKRNIKLVQFSGAPNEKRLETKVSSLFMVEISGIEPLTSWMPFKRSPSWAIPPCCQKPLILLDFWAIQFFDFTLRCGGAHPVACAPSWAIPPNRLSYATFALGTLISITRSSPNVNTYFSIFQIFSIGGFHSSSGRRTPWRTKRAFSNS